MTKYQIIVLKNAALMILLDNFLSLKEIPEDLLRKKAKNVSIFQRYSDGTHCNIPPMQDQGSFGSFKYKEKYPEDAKSSHVEGVVSLKFTITPDGNIKNSEIAKSSRNKILDEAALKALKDAAPFPKPPVKFFKGEVPLQISINFELT